MVMWMPLVTNIIWSKSEITGLPVLGVGFTGSLATTYSKHGDHRYPLKFPFAFY